MNHQTIVIATLIQNKHRVIHHGGQYCRIAGRRFEYRHVRLAHQFLFELREQKRALYKKDTGQ